MMVLVKAVRDSDGKVLGETVFDITDKQQRQMALGELLDQVYAAAVDPLNMPPFTFKFDKA